MIDPAWFVESNRRGLQDGDRVSFVPPGSDVRAYGTLHHLWFGCEEMACIWADDGTVCQVGVVVNDVRKE